MKRTTLVAKNSKIAPEPERLDLVVRGGKLVTPEGVKWADLGVRLGKIVQIAPEIKDLTHETIEADGAYIFPGMIDSHVHFNEPGRADWEGLGSGSAALAAGAVAAELHRIGRKHQCGHGFSPSLSCLSLYIPFSRACAHSLQS